MARSLVLALDRLQVVNAPKEPAFKVEIYDVRSTTDTINRIVRGLSLFPLTGPRDFTDEVESVTITEVAGDFVNTGVAASQLTFVIKDKGNQFHPLNMLLDATGDGRWLRAGNVIRITEGDNQVDTADWELTFTGTLIGTPGSAYSRESGDRVLTMGAVDRTAAFVNTVSTSPQFATGTTFLTMAEDIAQSDMNLDVEETDFATFGTALTGHKVQFVDESPLSSIAKIMMRDGFMPRFNGEGKLTQTQSDVTGFPDRFYTNLDPIIAIDHPQSVVEVFDSVCVLGLDADLSKVKQPFQVLAEVQLTTGYFAQDEDFDIFFSEDQTLLAENVTVNKKRDVNGALNFGGSSSDSLILGEGVAASEPSYKGVRIEISTGFAGALMVLIAVGYLAAAWIPDEVVSVVAGVTIPVGRAVQAAALITILLIMSQIGRYHAIILGEPVEYVYAEIRACAELDSLLGESPNRVEVENHLIQDQTVADNVAREILFRQVARANPRTVTNLTDLKLEPDDIFEVVDPVYGERRFLIERIQRTLQRGVEPRSVMNCFEITSGVTP